MLVKAIIVTTGRSRRMYDMIGLYEKHSDAIRELGDSESAQLVFLIKK